MANSSIRTVGKITLETGVTWRDVVARPALRARVVLEFHAQAARAFGLEPGGLQIHQMMHTPGVHFVGKELDWHRDACLEAGHVQTVLGDEPTEYLLGDYPESYLVDGAQFTDLESKLERFQPEPGTLIWLDRQTIHRRPLGVTDSLPARLFLLATMATRPLKGRGARELAR